MKITGCNMEDRHIGGMSFKTTNGGRTRAPRYDCRSAKDKVRGSTPTTLRFVQAEKSASDWRYITLDVESEVERQACELLLRTYMT